MIGRPPNKIELAGRRFCRLLVIEKATERRRQSWRCLCDCGEERIVTQANLINKHTKSCGCLALERRTRHGHSKNGKQSKIYKLWFNMRSRCLNPNVPGYADYGGRGIGVCEKWVNDFDSFRHDIGEPPSPTHSLDRIDNDGHYEPSNVRWAPRKAQARNTRTNRIVKLNGQEKTLAEWIEDGSLKSSTVRWRLKRGDSIEQALYEPLHKGTRLT